MKPGSVIVALILGAAAAVASAGDNGPMTDRAWMFYVSKSFGGTDGARPSPLAFGLRLQQASRWRPERPTVLLNASLRADGIGTLSLGGLTALRYGGVSDSGGSSEHSSEIARLHPGWTAVAVVAAVLAGACLAEEFICEDDDGYDRDEPYTPPPGNPG